MLQGIVTVTLKHDVNIFENNLNIVFFSEFKFFTSNFTFNPVFMFPMTCRRAFACVQSPFHYLLCTALAGPSISVWPLFFGENYMFFDLCLIFSEFCHIFRTEAAV